MNPYETKAKGVLSEFKAFALKGNVVDLAVAVVIGAAFGKIVTSLANNIIMPIFGALSGGLDFSSLTASFGNAEITYGIFLQSVLDFIIVALGIFLAIKFFNSIKKKEEAKPEQEKVAEPSEEILLLREIRDSLNK